MLRHLNEDHVVPEPQLLEGFEGLMIAVLAKAMDGERCFAGCTRMRNGLRRISPVHAGTIAHFLTILPVCRSAPIFLVVRLFFPKPDGTGMLEETMHEFLAQVAGSLAMKLPPPGLWSRFVRWAVWGKHAQSFSFPPASVAI